MCLVGLMILGMTVNPAVAWNCCGYWSYAPVYYGYGWGGCGGCDDCGVVVNDDCGGCGDCGLCDGCDSCGGEIVDEGVVVEHGVEVMPEQAPPAPMETPAQAAPQPPTSTETEMPPTLPAETPPQATTPPAVPAPQTPPVEEPANLFPTETPAETPPAEAAPPTQPATPPAETPATPPAEDDLFGGASTDAAPAATEPAPTAPPATTPTTPPAEGEKAANEDDLFGSAREILRESGGLESSEMRTWVDNTGKYSVNARLVRFLDGHVRLMKDTGRTTTVPMSRLSERDLEFVNRQASAQKAMTTQTAQTVARSMGIAN